MNFLLICICLLRLWCATRLCRTHIWSPPSALVHQMCCLSAPILPLCSLLGNILWQQKSGLEACSGLLYLKGTEVNFISSNEEAGHPVSILSVAGCSALLEFFFHPLWSKGIICMESLPVVGVNFSIVSTKASTLWNLLFKQKSQVYTSAAWDLYIIKIIFKCISKTPFEWKICCVWTQATGFLDIKKTTLVKISFPMWTWLDQKIPRNSAKHYFEHLCESVSKWD